LQPPRPICQVAQGSVDARPLLVLGRFLGFQQPEPVRDSHTPFLCWCIGERTVSLLWRELCNHIHPLP
jgi:hypothetical protein